MQPAYQPKKAPKPPSTHMGLPPGYQQTLGYHMFVKSLTEEILKRNPNADKVEMQKIVNQEWVKLPDDQKQVYEKLSANNQQQ